MGVALSEGVRVISPLDVARGELGFDDEEDEEARSRAGDAPPVSEPAASVHFADTF